MAIVRELLVRIGFITDKKAINATNNAITGFRTRFALAATAATFAISKITGFFSDIAESSLEAERLAATLGISIQQLNALNKGFKKFDFNDAQIVGVLSTLNQKFREFRIGANDEIGKVAAGLKFEVDRNAGPIKFFRDYLLKLGEIESEQQRIDLATTLFGEHLAPIISKLSQDVGGLDEAITKAFNENPDLSKSIENLNNYREAVKSLSDAWSSFSTSLSTTVLPVLTGLVGVLEQINGFYAGLFSNDKNVFKKSLEKGSQFFDPAFNATGVNQVADFFKDLGKQTGTINTGDDYQKYLNGERGYQVNPFLNPFATSNAMAVTNNVEINVPPGTNLDQSESFVDQFLDAIKDGIWNIFSNIQNDNPQVE